MGAISVAISALAAFSRVVVFFFFFSLPLLPFNPSLFSEKPRV